MFKILLKKIKRNNLDYGLLVCIQKICSHIFKPLFETRSYHIYVADLEKSIEQKPRLSSDFTFRLIGPEETAIIAQIENIEEWLHGMLAAKLRNNQKCLVALKGDTVAGFNLVGFNIFKLPLIRLAKPIRPTDCFSEQITVHPDFRNHGLGTDLRYEVFSTMRNDGYRRMYGGTQVCNNANKALSSKVGLKEFAVARFTNICGFKNLSIKRKKN